uniref:Uncharacterized protein n=1 Tax=Caulobacter sp. (strain K31) TaxID=366602 RepID=B0T895_CAUSK
MSLRRQDKPRVGSAEPKAQPSVAAACDFCLESLRMNVHSHSRETQYPSPGVGDYKCVIDLNFATARSYLTRSGGMMVRGPRADPLQGDGYPWP